MNSPAPHDPSADTPQPLRPAAASAARDTHSAPGTSSAPIGRVASAGENDSPAFRSRLLLGICIPFLITCALLSVATVTVLLVSPAFFIPLYGLGILLLFMTSSITYGQYEARRNTASSGVWLGATIGCAAAAVTLAPVILASLSFLIP